MAPVSFSEAEIRSTFAAHQQALIEIQHFSSLTGVCAQGEVPTALPWWAPAPQVLWSGSSSCRTLSLHSKPQQPEPLSQPQPNLLIKFSLPTSTSSYRKFGKLFETPGCAFAQQRTRWHLCHAPRSHSSGTSQRTETLFHTKKIKFRRFYYSAAVHQHFIIMFSVTFKLNFLWMFTLLCYNQKTVHYFRKFHSHECHFNIPERPESCHGPPPFC